MYIISGGAGENYFNLIFQFQKESILDGIAGGNSNYEYILAMPKVDFFEFEIYVLYIIIV